MRWLVAIALASCVQPQGETRIVIVRDLCESRFARPAVTCSSGELGFDGCRWACRLEPAERQDAAHLGLFSADYQSLLTTNLCASPNYCEGK